MLDAKNVVVLQGGIVVDPEMVADGKILKFRLGVDYAGSEKGKSGSSGYFDVTYFASDNPNWSFVERQIKEGKMKKGSQVSLVGRLVHERWESDGKTNSRVSITAENVTYAGNASRDDAKPAAKQESSSMPASF